MHVTRIIRGDTEIWPGHTSLVLLDETLEMQKEWQSRSTASRVPVQSVLFIRSLLGSHAEDAVVFCYDVTDDCSLFSEARLTAKEVMHYCRVPPAHNDYSMRNSVLRCKIQTDLKTKLSDAEITTMADALHTMCRWSTVSKSMTFEFVLHPWLSENTCKLWTSLQRHWDTATTALRPTASFLPIKDCRDVLPEWLESADSWEAGQLEELLSITGGTIQSRSKGNYELIGDDND